MHFNLDLNVLFLQIVPTKFLLSIFDLSWKSVIVNVTSMVLKSFWLTFDSCNSISLICWSLAMRAISTPFASSQSSSQYFLKYFIITISRSRLFLATFISLNVSFLIFKLHSLVSVHCKWSVFVLHGYVQ